MKTTYLSAKWRPIETAPKDGTYVIVAGPSGYGSTPLRCGVCAFVTQAEEWCTHAHNWWTDSGEDATLWMPLPECEELRKP